MEGLFSLDRKAVVGTVELHITDFPCLENKDICAREKVIRFTKQLQSMQPATTYYARSNRNIHFDYVRFLVGFKRKVDGVDKVDYEAIVISLKGVIMEEGAAILQPRFYFNLLFVLENLVGGE